MILVEVAGAGVLERKKGESLLLHFVFVVLVIVEIKQAAEDLKEMRGEGVEKWYGWIQKGKDGKGVQK